MRLLEASALSVLAGQHYDVDYLVEADSAGLHLAHTFSQAHVTWERRLQNIGEIEIALPPGGGLATVNSVQVTIAENASGQSLQKLHEAYGPIHGRTMAVDLNLPTVSSASGGRIGLFRGIIDQVEWDTTRGELRATDTSLRDNFVLPSTLVTSTLFPNAPEQSLNKRLPIVYGDGSALSIAPAPLLLVASGSRSYRAAEHGCQSLSGTLAIWLRDFDFGVTLQEDVSMIAVASAQNGLTITNPVTGMIFQSATGTLTLANQVNTANASNAFDANQTTFATIGTSNAAGFGGTTVQASFASGFLTGNIARVSADRVYGPSAPGTLESRTVVQAGEAVSSLLVNAQAFWRLEEAQGSNRVDSVDAHTLTPTGSVTQVSGRVGSFAAGFDGTSAFLQVASANELQFAGNQDFTITTWFRITGVQKNTPTIAGTTFRTGFSGGYVLSLEDLTTTPFIQWRVKGASAEQGLHMSTINASAGAWFHVVAYHNAGAKTIGGYVNNTALNTQPYSGGVASSGRAFTLGGGSGYATEDYLSGNIDATGVYDRVLTADEVSTLYNNGKGHEVSLGTFTVGRLLFDTTTQVSLASSLTTNVYPMAHEELTAGLQITQTAVFPGGTGSAGAVVRWSHVNVTTGYRPEATQVPLLSVRLQGRQDDAFGTVTGAVSALITHPTDVIRSILITERNQDVDTVTFDAARAALPGHVFHGGIGAGYPAPQITVREFLDRLCRQSRQYLFPDGNGAWKITAFDRNAPARHAITQEHILWTTGGENRPPGERHSTFRVLPMSLDDVHHTFEVFYGYHAGRQRYTKTAFANPTEDNHPTEDLATLCAESERRYGPLSRLTLEADFIQDSTTAFALLEHLVRYFVEHRIRVQAELPYRFVSMEVGDITTITHPSLPTDENGERFEILRLRYKLTQGRILIEARRLPPA